MLIGTDASIQECRASGYVVIETKGLMKRGVLDKSHDVHVTVSNPEAWPHGKARMGATHAERYAYDVEISFNELVERFNSAGDSIKSFCDWDNCPIELDNPTQYDFVQLASVVCGYCGLD